MPSRSARSRRRSRPFGRGVQLEQQRDVVEPEAVVARERGIDVAHDDGAGVGELEDGRKGGGDLGGGHTDSISLTMSLICRAIYQAVQPPSITSVCPVM